MRARPKKSATRKPAAMPWWQVVHIKGSPAAPIGRVRALDAESAISLAVEKYGITDQAKRERLAAYKVS
jgi:hypothetical protein